ncbi:MAG: DUF7453 family protein, partial [Steroidobacteraceae bacterium]
MCRHLASSLLLLFAAQAVPALERVIAAGEPAPGFEAGAVIEFFGDAPRIEREGHVSFGAIVRRPSGERVQALYRRVNGAIERIAVTGDPAPGAGNLTFQGFPFFASTPFISGGRVTFVADAVANGASITRTGVWTDRAGFLERLFLQGEALPAMPAGEEVTDFALDTRGNIALLRARFTRNLTQIFNEDNGLWRNADGDWRSIAVKGQPAAGISGAVFDGDLIGPGTISFFTARSDGRVLLQAWVEGDRVDDDNDEGLWIETVNGLQLLVREGNAAPLPRSSGPRQRGKGGKGGTGSATFGPTAAFSPTFGGDNENATPAINDAGQVVFGAVVRSSAGRSGSVWTSRSGTLELVALGSIGLVGSGPSSQAPGLPLGTTFATFQLTRINSSARIAFLGTTKEGDAFNFASGIWWDVPGSLSLVAAVGRQVGSVAGASYSNIRLLDRLTDTGELAFEAQLSGSGIDASNNVAVFRARPGGSAQPVLRTGDTVMTPEGARTIRSFAWGEGRTASDAGAAV